MARRTAMESIVPGRLQRRRRQEARFAPVRRGLPCRRVGRSPAWRRGQRGGTTLF